MKLRPEEITSILKQRIESYDVETDLAEVGTVLQIGDGIARVYGLESCMAMEMLELEHGVTGIALNLEEDNVGVALFGEWEKVSEGETVKRTGKVMSVPVGDELVGRIVNPLGIPLDGQGPLQSSESRLLEFKAPGVVNRQPVNEPLQTGIKAIDSMIPIGRGQRELVIGDRSTGQDGDPGRHDPEPARPGHDLHLRRHRPEGLDGGAGLRAPQGGGGDGLHDHRHGLGHRGGADQVDGALRRHRHGRALPLQRQARRLHVRRPLEARRRLPADVAAPAPARPAARRSPATSSTCTRACSSAPASSPTSWAAAR